MLASKKMTLKPLLESTDGVHLTVYMVNRGRLADLKRQLQDAMSQAAEWLDPVMSAEEKNKFFEPLNALLVDGRIFKQMKGNIGVFRHKDFFRVLNVPVPVEPLCQVATSFHVKPLLRWLQVDQEFLLLGIESGAAHLYLGSQDSIKLIDTVLFSESIKNKDHETFGWLSDWLLQLTKMTKPKLFIAGDKSLVKTVTGCLKYKNTVKTPAANFFNKTDVNDICFGIRKVLRAESKVMIEKALMEFRFAEEDHRAQKNIFQIAKAVVRGRVRKLIVSDELSILGKIDRKSGGLAIHPFDLDHEDDDILDDLAQMVLSQGGEVIVASRDEIPKGRPILAILDDDGDDLEKTEASDQYEILNERFG